MRRPASMHIATTLPEAYEFASCDCMGSPQPKGDSTTCLSVSESVLRSDSAPRITLVRER